MQIKCGWASQSENKTANGKKGNQSGVELKIGNYYDSFNPDTVVRIRNIARRKKAANAMKKLIANKNIGYGQSDRTSLYNECVHIGWNIKKISEIKKCNCDCSMLVLCAINFAFGKCVVRNCTTSSFVSCTSKVFPKKFKEIKHWTKDDLRLGDCVLKAGRHVIMVVERKKD